MLRALSVRVNMGWVEMTLVSVALPYVPVRERIAQCQSVAGAVAMPGAVGFVAGPDSIGMNFIVTVGRSIPRNIERLYNNSASAQCRLWAL